MLRMSDKSKKNTIRGRCRSITSSVISRSALKMRNSVRKRSSRISSSEMNSSNVSDNMLIKLLSKDD